MTLIKMLDRGASAPWYYGYVKQSLVTNQTMMAVVPLHLVLRAWELVTLAWTYFLWYGCEEDHRALESRVVRAYEEGLADGRRIGIQDANLHYRQLIEDTSLLMIKLDEMQQQIATAYNLVNAFKGDKPR